MPNFILILLWSLLAVVILAFIVTGLLFIAWQSWNIIFIPVYKRYKFNIEKAQAERDLYAIEVRKADLIEINKEYEEKFAAFSVDLKKMQFEKNKLEKEMSEDKILYQELQLKKKEKELADQAKEIDKQAKKEKQKS
ncbi:MAG: hypothetical protein RBQ91_08020 [Acholeplasma sp.]|nr:hypothetical protein [Acholeplasma sp.]